MTVLARVRAPASTANLGAGFDCAAVALDLWNEVVVSDGDGEPDHDHVGVRAFSLLAPADGKQFAFTDRIPREQGLGSSAAVIALGLVAAAAVTGRDRGAESLLAAGLELEGHADNLAAALTGGVCLTWAGKIARIAEGPPALPIAVIPETRVSTREARAALPRTVAHEDAAFSVARAALLGVALAWGSSELFAESLADRLHEPYRGERIPLLEELREHLPAGALGVTISGSGPALIVWAPGDSVVSCVDELTSRYPEVEVRELAVSPLGAHIF